MGEYNEALEKMQGAYEASEKEYATTFGGEVVDEGVYTAQLQSATMKTSSQGNLMIRRSHLILEGDWEGSVVRDNVMISEDRLVYVRRWIEMIGFQCPVQLSELEGMVEDIVKAAPTVEIAVKHNISGDITYCNVYVNKLLDGEGAEVPAQQDVTEEAFDIGSYISLANTYSVEGVKEDSSEDEVLTAFNEYGWSKDDLDPEEADLLLALGVEVEGAEAPEEAPAEEAPEVDPIVEKAQEFCIAQDIKYDQDDDLDILKERVSEYDYKEEELTKDEVSLLNDLGLKDRIKKPAPKKKPAGKKTPAKKSAGKKAPAKKKGKK